MKLPLGHSILSDSLFGEDTVALLTHRVLDMEYVSRHGIVPSLGWPTSSANEEDLSWDNLLYHHISSRRIKRLNKTRWSRSWKASA